MPTYTFIDNDTGLTFDEFMGMSEKDQYLEDNPHISQVPVMFAFVGDHIMVAGPKTDGIVRWLAIAKGAGHQKYAGSASQVLQLGVIHSQHARALAFTD